ncbi:MAG TPA: HEAT repeat domain-containing protein, partial [Methanothrix sp.]|nr:HEAT repeat domain-containing protein [Methanothrix sp.]
MRDWGKEKTASDPKTEAKELEALARDWDWHVRRAVAINPGAPIEILRHLANDQVQWVREAVAASLRADGDILEFLSEDGDGFVRAAVALNQKTSPGALTKLSSDVTMDFDYSLSKNRYIVQEAAAKNPNTPEEVNRTLADHGDEGVR